MTEKEFKDWQKSMLEDIARSGLTQEEWVERWLDRVYGPEPSSNDGAVA